SSSGASNIAFMAATGAKPVIIKADGALTSYHFAGGSGTPTIAAGTGAGTGATVSITGTDAAGEITITTGTSPTAGAALATVTFNTAYSTAPYITLQRSSTASPSDMELGSRTTTNFTI